MFFLVVVVACFGVHNNFLGFVWLVVFLVLGLLVGCAGCHKLP